MGADTLSCRGGWPAWRPPRACTGGKHQHEEARWGCMERHNLCMHRRQHQHQAALSASLAPQQSKQHWKCLTPWTISQAAKHHVWQIYQSCLCQLSQRWPGSYCLPWRAHHCAVLHGQVDLMTFQRASACWLLPYMQSRGHEVRP